MTENSSDKSESQKIYRSMARVSSNAESIRVNDGYSSQLTNYILDSGTTCHMTPDI